MYIPCKPLWSVIPGDIGTSPRNQGAAGVGAGQCPVPQGLYQPQALQGAAMSEKSWHIIFIHKDSVKMPTGCQNTGERREQSHVSISTQPG